MLLVKGTNEGACVIKLAYPLCGHSDWTSSEAPIASVAHAILPSMSGAYRTSGDALYPGSHASSISSSSIPSPSIHTYSRPWLEISRKSEESPLVKNPESGDHGDQPRTWEGKAKG